MFCVCIPSPKCMRIRKNENYMSSDTNVCDFPTAEKYSHYYIEIAWLILVS